VTPVSQWSAFGTVGDLDADEAGQGIETDAEFRERRNLALLARGNDFEAIVAAVSQVAGVTYVGGMNNRSAATVDGVPGGAVEIVVLGGDDTEIAVAIKNSLPPGTEAFGDTTVSVPYDAIPGAIDIGFSRPTAISIWLRITVSSTGSELEPSPSAAATIAAAVLAQANSVMSDPGTDVIPGALSPYVWSSTVDAATGRPTLTSVLVEASDDGVSYATTPIVISHTERANFDSARISIVGP
jgi:hypothetical protein